ncbi:TPA: dephospho-CoA kinase [Providencia alcalifaciens]|uniref:Dephospho-CoA kinase n=3 Tax=Providencia alcalifaciens TaxID=126385 RepID=A0AAW9V7I3_9GAMM|nr:MULTISPECIES: dephospho-CoA kinase [Providencia]ATG16623.1 dephospho-CoA kinase [Providencia alcalifaciens]EEB44214.1 dephospho-CoA kinase [Providencia alcalifaciens DSM 30120]EKT66992.1 dephospho-CoA kinase [Providencia alcalifaciens Dmel2]ETT07344.1 dephospho-CoA kinase [Providencia alcalifaciens F90-2004]EUC96611.1 dephospho-CoA kinase [Providencia alcalifaciens PAL-2]
MSYIVALTGGIGSGKTTVANEFAKLGVPLVDADVIARQVVEPNTPAIMSIAQHFGQNVINHDGSLNRGYLRTVVFSKPEEKMWLNALLHPLIQQETQKQLQQANYPYVLWVVPLLVENKITHLADRVLVVDVTREEQIERTIQRDNADREHVIHILDAQASREERLSYADDIITNHTNDADIPNKVVELHKQYLALAAQKE